MSRVGLTSSFIVGLLFSALSDAVQAQKPHFKTNPSVPESVSEGSIFAPLEIAPVPNAVRLANGKPGPKYWQNRVDYYIKAHLDTTAGSVQGALTMKYRNNSPDALDVIWVHLEQNRFKGTQPKSGDGARLKRHGDHYGYTIHSVKQKVNGEYVDVEIHEDPETLAKISLVRPLESGKETSLQIVWHYYVPPGGNRMGRDTADRVTYALAQWFPRAVVYDDIEGWNLDPYVGSGEFYTNFGDYTVEISVPANFTVAATGRLVNSKEILTPDQLGRLSVAARSDTVVRVITGEDIAAGTARPHSSKMVTWKFQADNVRDVVWAASPLYQWDATSWNGILTQAFYRPASQRTWSHAADMTRFSIREYSTRWHFMYPYPHMTAVETPEGGMEYPMVTFVHGFDSIPQLFNVIAHEVGHMWFPMIVNSNERIHAWLDEGIDQFINTFADGTRHPELGNQKFRVQQLVNLMNQVLIKKQDVPLAVPPDQIPRPMLGYQAYRKPAGVIHLLRAEILGEEVFDKALREYLQRWAYKHPMPVDFFRTLEDVSGRNLDWFWRQFFFEAPLFDQAIGDVNSENGELVVEYRNLARGVLPIRARLTFSDGTMQDISHPAEIWMEGSTVVQRYPIGDKTVVSVIIDPDERLLDVNRDNNTWKYDSDAER